MSTSRRLRADLFDRVRAIGLALPGVESATKYDGSPVLRWGGAFVAGMATHTSAEPGTLVVRMDVDDRVHLLDEASETYYVTDYYRKYPLVLVRLAHVDDDALRDLLAGSRTLTLGKGRPRRRHAPTLRRARRRAERQQKTPPLRPR